VIAAVLCLSAAVIGTGGQARDKHGRELSPDVWVSVFAGGNFGPGWWYVDVARPADGKLVVSGSELLKRRLTPDEERTLASLVAALSPNRRLSFGIAYIDITTTFELRVKSHDGWRTYSVTSDLGHDADKKEVQAILRVLHFLYGLLGSSEATRPPEPTSETRGRRTRG